jgi:DNA-binding transcriptional LysR family regulator
MKQRIQIYLLLMLSAIPLMYSCTKGSNRIGKQEILCMSHSGSEELMLGLVKQFLGPRPDVSFRLVEAGQNMPASLDSGSINMFIIAGDTSAYTGKGIMFIELARRAVMPVFCYENPDISLLARQGVNPLNLGAAYSGIMKSWSELSPGAGNSILRAYTLQQGDESSNRFFSWLGIQPQNSLELSGAEEMTQILMKDTFGLGQLWSSDFYDPQTGFRKPGLYALPLDLDSSGMIEDAEHIYDDIRMFSKALYNNAYPSELSTTYYLAVSSEGHNKALAEFIKWLQLEGADACRALGYSRPSGSEAGN